jgi:hypothetical protein
LTFSKLVKQVILPNKQSWSCPRRICETAVSRIPSADAKFSNSLSWRVFKTTLLSQFYSFPSLLFVFHGWTHFSSRSLCLSVAFLGCWCWFQFCR